MRGWSGQPVRRGRMLEENQASRAAMGGKMENASGRDYVLGVDFGTDSVRAVVVDAADGGFAGSGVSAYRRWAAGAWCDPSSNCFRQHPLDYIEGLEDAGRQALAQAGAGVASRIRAISVDTRARPPA